MLVLLVTFWCVPCKSTSFIPWDDLVMVPNPHPSIESNESWIFMGQQRMQIYTVNAGAYEVGFDIADMGDNNKHQQ